MATPKSGKLTSWAVSSLSVFICQKSHDFFQALDAPSKPVWDFWSIKSIHWWSYGTPTAMAQNQWVHMGSTGHLGVTRWVAFWKASWQLRAASFGERIYIYIYISDCPFGLGLTAKCWRTCLIYQFSSRGCNPSAHRYTQFGFHGAQAHSRASQFVRELREVKQGNLCQSNMLRVHIWTYRWRYKCKDAC